MDRHGMRSSQSVRAPRAPLGDATNRMVNTSKSVQSNRKPSKRQKVAIEPLPSSPASKVSRPGATKPQTGDYTSAAPNMRIPVRDSQNAVNRDSQISVSTVASGSNRKTHIGPWHLGRTLGKGSAGRVRLARHYLTYEEVAVKILPKHPRKVTQSGSLTAVDAWDRSRPEFAAENRIPISIEREIAILKLIDHPNIMKLHDIWENRSEIYLVLEFVERGDLFSYISKRGPLPEDETMFYFRQIVSALEYCHAFNISHRDLKPENILMTNDWQIKIADFGMAAIQQAPGHRLTTPCGSPHYAAPELVSQRHGYHGPKADIWSLGIIVYACVCARLPFDVDDVETQINDLLDMARMGDYYEPEDMSRGMTHLIRRMLTVDPNQRITTEQIWQHPFVILFDDMDNLNDKQHKKRAKNKRDEAKKTPVAKEDIDNQTFRQLKAVFHKFTEPELTSLLADEKENEIKLFYWLLFDYREKQLENYIGNITYSPSDFHHLAPANWKKKFRTLAFGEDGERKETFTVISTVPVDDNADHEFEAATDCGRTVYSYDPYHSSRIMGGNVEASRARITVHRNGSLAKSSTRATNLARRNNGSINGSVKSSSTYSREKKRNRHIGVSSDGTLYARRPVSSHKRGVDFSFHRKRSLAYHSRASIAGDDTTYGRDRTSPTSPARRQMSSKGSCRNPGDTQSMLNVSREKQEKLWTDELDQFSNSIAKDCDEAFKSSLLSPESYLGGDTSIEPSAIRSSFLDYSRGSKSPSIKMETPTPAVRASKDAYRDSRQWDDRPLPQAPTPTSSVLDEILLAKKRTELRQRQSGESLRHVDKMRLHHSRLVPPMTWNSEDGDRRAVSAPIYSQYSTQRSKNTAPLPSINEAQREGSSGDQDRQRIVSAPVADASRAHVRRNLPGGHKDLEYLSRQDKTIRVVTSPSHQQSPVKALSPLNLRKKLSRGVAAYPQERQELSLRQQYMHEEMREPIPEEPPTLSQRNSFERVKKKASWFKRSSKDKDDAFNSKEGSCSSLAGDAPYAQSHSSSASLGPTKKKSFSFAFWRNSRDQDQMKLSLAGPDVDDSPSPEPIRMFSHPARPTDNRWNENNVANRNIEPQQNWLARLFRVKPATGHLCFTISRRRARQEVAILLKEWRRYGIRDVQVDKERNIVFARVGNKNYLDMKEVSFAAEIMTVIEHGKRNHLSIVRFTQERGAASSFYKVVDTMHAVFSVRNLLVTDKRKIKMMIKTLNS